MVLSEGWIHNGFFQFFQVIGIRVRQCTVKILDQYIKICRMSRSFLHFQVAFPDRLRHFALTHILSDDNIACVNDRAVRKKGSLCRTHRNTHIHPEVMPRGLHQPASWYYLLNCYKRWNIFYSSWMQTSGWLEMPHFMNRISSCISS